MPSILDQIVAERRLDSFPEVGELVASTRSLEASLRQRNFIMECKSASPSKGVLRADYRPRELARIYSQYAGGISVLCEPRYFGGSYEHLATVAASTHLPVLCKDFIVLPEQIRAARYFGADAILLMLSVLSDDEYRELSALATSLGLDILTETMSVAEVERAIALDARIIGINNRNLHDLSVNLDRTRELAPFIKDRLIVSESGIANYQDVRELSSLVDAFLVGSSLSGETDADAAVRRLVYGENKVCGLTSAGAAQVARAAGAVYGGLIFADSPRQVTVQQAQEIMRAEPELKYVVVSRETCELPGAYAVQLHGPYQGSIEAELDYVRSQPGRVWRAVDMTREGAVDLAITLAPEVDRLILDTGSGGTGATFDWSVIPDDIKHKALLAGGIGLDNIAEALAVGCAGLDLNSRLESTPGTKDPHLITAAFHTIAKG
ncbi:indole-3-glycerol phosphate synthase [Corynebacterium epidermidicanis]|uniref:Multifunctional fusion protein n=1 Tax=Corynebacterium epidermidicanis TaxID=1050174 RepID=A0A0G3GT25_9CORY|nr:bifunctional indole-3-glycerol-phosphate synthase TrpC/phosphoribosylanthranilate isomerase TrpF [Corynebacterium epidermidicanis]AKK04331.1 indole-3-glycerol phosphate synthase [Corynebacterium epidermidicanis]